MKKIIFICTHNSVRSQIAEAFMNKYYSKEYVTKSAGITPTEVHPLAKAVMSELGIDISNQKSKSIQEFLDEDLDIAVTVCDETKKSCPTFPAKKTIHKGFKDPTTSDDIKQFRLIRDKIKNWIDKEFRN